MTAVPEVDRARRVQTIATKSKVHAQSGVIIRRCKIGDVITIPPDELQDLKIDESYQRSEIRGTVNALIAILEQGGVIADAATIAVRKNGDRYIVDGQQRFWAHLNSERPFRAQLIYVDDLETERALFSALNTTSKPHPNIRVKAWPGPSGAIVHWLNDSPSSPVRAEVGFGANGSAKYGAKQIADGLYVALSGAAATGSRKVELLMRWIDNYCVRDRSRVTKTAQFYMMLWKSIRDGKFPIGHSCALALACYTRWNHYAESQIWPVPSPNEISRLRRMNWFSFAPDGKPQWVPLLTEQILKRWTTA